MSVSCTHCACHQRVPSPALPIFRDRSRSMMVRMLCSVDVQHTTCCLLHCSRKREEDEAREAKKESKFGRHRHFAHGGHEEAGTRTTGQRHGAPK